MPALIGELGSQFADALGAGDHNLVAENQILELVEEFRESVDNLLCGSIQSGACIDPAAAEPHVITHHPGTGERFEQIEDFFAFAECVHQRRAPRAHVAEQKSEERSVILQPGQLGQNDPQIFGAIGDFDAGEVLHAEGIGPVVSHGTKIIEPIGIRHRAEISGVLADFLVVAMEITENRFELAHDFAVERDVHAKDAVGRWMLRPHRHFEQFAFEPGAHAARGRLLEFLKPRCAHKTKLTAAR